MKEQIEKLAGIIRSNIKETKMSFGDSGNIYMIDIDSDKTAQDIIDAGYRLPNPDRLTLISPEDMSETIQRDCTKWDVCSKDFMMDIAAVIAQAQLSHNLKELKE